MVDEDLKKQIERAELMKVNFAKDIKDTIKLLTDLKDGEEITFELKEDTFVVMYVGKDYYMLEAPTIIEDQWDSAVVYSYSTEEMHNLVERLVESKY